MNHAKLSRDLAQALGWKISHVTALNEVHVCLRRGSSRRFDYRDSSVCLPLIKRLLTEHSAAMEARPAMTCVGVYIVNDGWYWGDTLEEAVARALIAVKGGKT